jgi:hypothetical protein
MNTGGISVATAKMDEHHRDSHERESLRAEMFNQQASSREISVSQNDEQLSINNERK